MTLTPTVRALAWFSAGAVTFAIIGSVFVVFVLQWYDPKYQDALLSALQVQLMGMAVFVIGAILVLGAVLMFRTRGRAGSTAGTRVAWIAGVIFPLGVLLLGQLLHDVEPESLVNPLVGWGFMIAYPLVAGFLIER
jgi:hypothetical protein